MPDRKLSQDELDRQEGEQLPDREVMTTLNPPIQPVPQRPSPKPWLGSTKAPGHSERALRATSRAPPATSTTTTAGWPSTASVFSNCVKRMLRWAATKR